MTEGLLTLQINTVMFKARDGVQDIFELTKYYSNRCLKSLGQKSLVYGQSKLFLASGG
jgi:hypothetical protein